MINLRRKGILVTGVTGLIGGEIAARLCNTGFKVWGLIRAQNNSEAWQYIRKRFARSGRNIPSNFFAITGDICKRSLGINKSDMEMIREECGIVVHCAGNTSFREDKSCYSTNVKGIHEIIRELSAWNRSPRVIFLSTSFVASAPKNSEISEDAPQIGYANGYIRSKRRVEHLLRKSGLDFTILRPSIVISKGVADRNFARSVLWFIPTALQLGSIPLNRKSLVDIVPVDYVVECIYSIIRRKPSFDCYHITAGASSSVSCEEVAGFICTLYNKRISFISLRNWLQDRETPHICKIMRSLLHYIPFINSNVTYSCDRIRKELGDEIPYCPKFTDYCENVLALITTKEALLESYLP